MSSIEYEVSGTVVMPSSDPNAYLQKVNDLSDLNNKETARNNLLGVGEEGSVLSIKAGKISWSRISGVGGGTSSGGGMSYMGEVNTFLNLPTTAMNGDIYRVKSETEVFENGVAIGFFPIYTCYAYTTYGYIPLGGMIKYLTDEEVNEICK